MSAPRTLNGISSSTRTGGAERGILARIVAAGEMLAVTAAGIVGGAAADAASAEAAHDPRGALGDANARACDATATVAADTAAVAPAEADLAVYFLGPQRVLVDGERVDSWSSARARQVFNYLVAHRQHPVSREQLMVRFWPDATAGAARNSLNVAIHGVRRTLARGRPGASFVLFRDARYRLSEALRVWVDAEAFGAAIAEARRCARSGDAPRALALYQAAIALHDQPFLSDEPGDDWIRAERDRHFGAVLEACAWVSAHLLDHGDAAGCLAACQQGLRLEPCNEDLHRRLMRCYSRTGQQHLALRQYHACCDALAREFGATPGIETVRLHDQVRRRVEV